MPIQTVNDPGASRAIAAAAFAAKPLPAGLDLAEAANPVEQIGALPLFNLSATALVAGKWSEAVQTGWRYARLGSQGQRGDTVDVSLDESPVLLTHARGSTASRLAEAANETLAHASGGTHDFEARILRIPSIGVEAIWLFPKSSGAEPHFIGLPVSQRDWKGRTFLANAGERARNFLKQRS